MMYYATVSDEFIVAFLFNKVYDAISLPVECNSRDLTNPILRLDQHQCHC